MGQRERAPKSLIVWPDTERLRADLAAADFFDGLNKTGIKIMKQKLTKEAKDGLKRWKKSMLGRYAIQFHEHSRKEVEPRTQEIGKLRIAGMLYREMRNGQLVRAMPKPYRGKAGCWVWKRNRRTARELALAS